ncbi:YtxH domain-containing protein [Candidatus Nomurabacteria bacterium]|nr:YtxH domain-containing protein [Candidatus Nomurabacteria bacterium]
MSRTESFMKGIILGTIVGAAAGVLFAPKSGEETRKELKKKAEELKSQAEVEYKKAKVVVDKKLANLKEVGKKIDKAGYEKLVKNVIDEIKNDKKVTEETAQKLSEMLKADWKLVSNAVKA